jgi:hypothetical protein
MSDRNPESGPHYDIAKQAGWWGGFFFVLTALGLGGAVVDFLEDGQLTPLGAGAGALALGSIVVSMFFLTAASGEDSIGDAIERERNREI